MMEFWLPDVGDAHWIRELRARGPSRITLKICRSTGRGYRSLLQLVDISAEPSVIAAIEQFLRGDRDLVELSMARLSPSRLVARVVGPAPPFCVLSQRSGAVCSACRFLADGRSGAGEWVVLLPGTSEARPILRELRRQGHRSSVAAWQVRRYRPPGGLTPRQADALEAALQLGYYRFPRSGRLADIGRSLGISRSTAAELLRRAEAKVVGLAVAA